MKFLMKFFWIALVFSGNLYAQILVENAWVRAMPPSVKNSSAYMLIKNTSNQPVRITHIESPQFMQVHSHKTIIKNAIASMVPTELIVPAKGQIILKPANLHLMLMHHKTSIIKGEIVDIILHWGNHKKTMIKAKIK